MNGAFGTLVRKEFGELRRDRRVLLLTLVLPVVLYPLVIGAMNRAQQQQESSLDAARYVVAVAGRDPALERVLGGAEGLDWIRSSADSLVTRIDLGQVVLGVELPAADAPADTVRLVGRMTRNASQTAADRIEAALEAARHDSLQSLYANRGGEGRLDGALGVRTVNVSTAREAGGAEAGRMIVYLLLMTLFMAASTLSIDMIAGEKERGTLETLFLAPLDRVVLARAKLAVAAAGALVTGLLSLASLAGSYAVGWLGASGAADLDPVSLAMVGVLMLPLAVLLAAVLLVVSAWARSLKEAQYFLLPLLMVVFVPAFLSMSQAIETTVAVSLIPIANVAFVMRDVLAGRIDATTVVLVVGSTVVWIVLAARQVAVLMEREETVLGFDPEPFFAPTEGGRRRAMQVAMALTVLGYFYVGQWLQARAPSWGLAASLWILLPALGLATHRLVRGSLSGWRARLSLHAPSPAGLLAAPLLGVGLLLPMVTLQMAQARFLPMPTDSLDQMAGVFAALDTWTLVLLAAVSPAICEEFVFRGVFFGHLREQGSARRAVLWSAFWFALIHLSVFRFLPTFLLGVLLAIVVLRTGSIVPAVVFHLVYNGALVVGERLVRTWEPPFALDGPVAWGASLVMLATAAGLLARGSLLRRAGSDVP